MHAQLQKKVTAQNNTFSKSSYKKHVGSNKSLNNSSDENIELQNLQTLSNNSVQISEVSQLQEMADTFSFHSQPFQLKGYDYSDRAESPQDNSLIQRNPNENENDVENDEGNETEMNTENGITLNNFKESTKERRHKRGKGIQNIDALVWKYEKLTKGEGAPQERYSVLSAIEVSIKNWNEKHKNSWGGRIKKFKKYLQKIENEKNLISAELELVDENSSTDQGVNDIKEGIGSFDQQDLTESMKSSASPKEKKTGADKLEAKKDKGLRKSLKGVVMNIQRHHGQMDQFDTFIKGDAAVNSYYSDEAEKAEAGDQTAELYEQAIGSYLPKMHDKVLNKKEKSFKKSTLKKYKESSFRDAKQSDQMLAKAKDADGFAQAYYVQHGKLGVQRKEEKDENKKSQIREKQKANYIDAKDLLYAVREDRKKMEKRRDGLRAEGRVVSLGGAIWNGIKMGGIAGAIKFLSFGTRKFVAKRDGRGRIGEEKFDLDLNDGKAERHIDQGDWVQTLSQQFQIIYSEFKAKISKRAKSWWGKLSGFLDAFNKGIEILRGIFSATATWLTGLSFLLPPMATIFAPISAVLTWLSSLFKGIGASVSALKLVADGIANIFVSDPSLFTELRGELISSTSKTVTNASSLATNHAYKNERAQVNNHGEGNLVQSDIERITKGPEQSIKMDMDKTSVKNTQAPDTGLFEKRWAKRGLIDHPDLKDEASSSNTMGQVAADGGLIVADVSTDIAHDTADTVVNAGVESADRNDVNYNTDYDGQQTDKNRKGQDETVIEDDDKRERLKEALETLKAKSKTNAAELQNKLKKYKTVPQVPQLNSDEPDRISDADRRAREEANNVSQQTDEMIRETIAEMENNSSG